MGKYSGVRPGESVWKSFSRELRARHERLRRVTPEARQCDPPNERTATLELCEEIVEALTGVLHEVHRRECYEDAKEQLSQSRAEVLTQTPGLAGASVPSDEKAYLVVTGWRSRVTGRLGVDGFQRMLFEGAEGAIALAEECAKRESKSLGGFGHGVKRLEPAQAELAHSVAVFQVDIDPSIDRVPEYRVQAIPFKTKS